MSAFARKGRGFTALRKLANGRQVDLRKQLEVKQPSVHKIEKQTDLYGCKAELIGKMVQ